jgi:aminoglycoside phosphotransferase
MAVVPEAEERTSYGMAAPRYRWADLPVASWSLTWNYQGDWQGLFFDTYGVEPTANASTTTVFCGAESLSRPGPTGS